MQSVLKDCNQPRFVAVFRDGQTRYGRSFFIYFVNYVKYCNGETSNQCFLSGSGTPRGGGRGGGRGGRGDILHHFPCIYQSELSRNCVWKLCYIPDNLIIKFVLTIFFTKILEHKYWSLIIIWGSFAEIVLMSFLA